MLVLENFDDLNQGADLQNNSQNNDEEDREGDSDGVGDMATSTAIDAGTELVANVIPGKKDDLVLEGFAAVSKLVLKKSKKSINQLNKLVKTGKAPKSIKRFDTGKIKGEIDHVHFKNGSALNKNGSWKHGSKTLSRQESNFLKEAGWTLSKQ